jgi:hypothetical protein
MNPWESDSETLESKFWIDRKMGAKRLLVFEVVWLSQL